MRRTFFRWYCSREFRTAVLTLILAAPLFWTTRPAFADSSPATEAPAAPAATGSDMKSANADKSGVDSPASLAGREEDEYYELLKLLTDTISQVDRNYIEKVDRRELVEAAIQGVMSKLDSYSTYVPPEEIDAFRSDMEGAFGGIGIRLAVDDGRPKVLSPLFGSPACRAGLVSGDIITRIDGKATGGLTLETIVRRLKGPVETEVHLTVFHPHSNKTEDVTLKREIIRIETVLGDRRNRDGSWEYVLDRRRGLAYIRITAFGRLTADNLRKVLERLAKENMKGLVLDLRFNPGGLLTSAVGVSDLFLDKGRIVTTTGRNVKEQSWQATADHAFVGFPMVVLVNKYSASAAEIVAACLQDHGRAIVVGERTWGKGSVQNVIQLEDGRSALKLTTSGYHRPSGKKIHRLPGEVETDDWGVSPNENYVIRLTREETATLHFEQRRKCSFDPGRSDGESDGAYDPDAPPPFEDRQLRTAILCLREKLGEKIDVPAATPPVVSSLKPPKTAPPREPDPPESSRPNPDPNESRRFPFFRRLFDRRQ
jgi:carboxyl-terminal processing protease